MTATLADQAYEPHFPIKSETSPYVVFEYLYRDASNYKAFGELWLTGSLSHEGRASLLGSLESGEFFVAEQVGVPPLYDKLFSETGGPTSDDHAWHTFAGLREELLLPGDIAVWGKSADLLAAIMSASNEWKPQLSSNFSN